MTSPSGADITVPSADDVVDAARGGDRDALEALLRTHQPAVHRLCRRLTGNDSDADDATQEALIAIVRGLPRFDGRSAFSTWVYRIATNASLDELRRRQRRPRLLDHGDDPGPQAVGTAASATDEPGLADQLVDRLRLDDALRRLPIDYRAAVVLRDVIGLDYAEIAEILDLAPGTVRSRISRGRAAMARHLRSDRMDPPETGNRGATPDVRRSET